ncbi:MAG: proline dehydrogenase family protein [Planctomycetota bacterium]
MNDIFRQILLKVSTLTALRLLFTNRNFLAIKKRFIAGDTIDDAIRVAKYLANNNLLSTIDFLGEEVKNKIKAKDARECYIKLLKKIKENHLPASISVKPSHFGILIDENFCFDNLYELVEHTKNTDNFLCIDMEGFNLFEKTLHLHKKLVDKYFAVGIVVQAYLYRAEEIMREAIKNTYSVRLCKGAYREPPSIAYQDKKEINKNYLKLAFLLVDNCKNFYDKFSSKGPQYCGIGIATHDHNLIEAIIQYTKDKKIDKKHFEFQMLYGVRPQLQRKIVSLGYSLRIYVPFGKEWYSYTLRRMAERPSNFIFVARNILS